MPTATYTPLATVTLGGTASSVTFSSIPATYRDLIFSLELVGSVSEQYFMRLNGDTGSNYSWVQMGADSTGFFTSSTTTTGIRVGFFSAISARDNLQLSIMDYSATDKHKTALVRTNSNCTVTRAIAGRWANTAAVTSVVFTFPSGNFNSGSTISLYGVIA
jgi:hypothetical protein